MASSDWEGHPFAEPVCYDCLPDHLPHCELPASIFAGQPLRECTCPERRHMLRHRARDCDCERCVASEFRSEPAPPRLLEDDGRSTWRGSGSESQHRPKEERWYSVLSKVPGLWPLEHELGERPKLNARLWRAHEAHLAACPFSMDVTGDTTDLLCPDPKHQRPRCRSTHLWLEEWPRFSSDLVAHSPQLWDKFGSWQLLVEYRADFTYWMRRLPPFYKRLAYLIAEGKKGTPTRPGRPWTLDEIAYKLGLGPRGSRRRGDDVRREREQARADVRRAIKLLNGFLRRAAMRESHKDAERELEGLMRALIHPVETPPLSPVTVPPAAA